MVGGATRMPQIQQAVAEFFGAAAAQQSQSRPGRRARRRDPGERARGQPRYRRRLAAARRHPAVARASRRWAARREDHPAQRHDPDRARAGIHDLQGRPDRDGDPRRAGRAREGRRLPVARALRAARASRRWWRAPRASASRSRSTPTDSLVGLGARADHGRRGSDHRQAFVRARRTPTSRACWRNRTLTPPTTWRARALAESAGRGERMVAATEGALAADGDLLDARTSGARHRRRRSRRCAGSPAGATATRSMRRGRLRSTARPRNSPPGA